MGNEKIERSKSEDSQAVLDQIDRSRVQEELRRAVQERRRRAVQVMARAVEWAANDPNLPNLLPKLRRCVSSLPLRLPSHRRHHHDPIR